MRALQQTLVSFMAALALAATGPARAEESAPRGCPSAGAPAQTQSTMSRHPTASADSPDYQAIQKTIEEYLRGHAQASATAMRHAFLPTAHVEGNRQGKFTSWTLDDYAGLFTGTVAADEASRVRTIDWIDIQGDAAAAKARLVHGTTTFTDYFVLLKVNGEWRIANKVYHGRPTAER